MSILGKKIFFFTWNEPKSAGYQRKDPEWSQPGCWKPDWPLQWLWAGWIFQLDRWHPCESSTSRNPSWILGVSANNPQCKWPSWQWSCCLAGYASNFANLKKQLLLLIIFLSKQKYNELHCVKLVSCSCKEGEDEVQEKEIKQRGKTKRMSGAGKERNRVERKEEKWE